LPLRTGKRNHSRNRDGAEAVAWYGDKPPVRPGVFLHPDTEETVEHCRHSYPKKRHRLPTILSQDEVAQLIDAAPTAFYRTVLMTLYATGVRNAELTRLRISDVDSQRMVLHVQGGKGRQDRDVMLSRSCSKNSARTGDDCAKIQRLVVSRESLARRRSAHGYTAGLSFCLKPK
jgi:integrase